VLLADGDMRKYWFRVGRVYLRVSLKLEDLGLSQATSAAIVEASNYHDDIEASLHTTKRALAIIRIGQGSTNKQYSPRLTAAELLSTSA
jgi:hypothetical protein